MGKITKITQATNTPYLNFYELDTVNKTGKEGRYFVASRAKNADELKLNSGRNDPDGVVIYSLYGEKQDRVVLIRQYRYPLGGYVYELPAGLVDPGENYHRAAIRELKEETGLDLKPITVDEIYQKPYFTTVGMTDESCGTVYGYASGEISEKYMEDSEEIEVILADRKEVRRILQEENVALICAYMMMHFLHDEEPFGFLRKE
ncbi:MAG: NUDIX hydrolase [Clostridiales bacterium]|nr:NUDIX hydrolase [Clostridiales bacterium]